MYSTDLSAWEGKDIAVGLSGGVDSSIAIAMLKEAGARVTGITMKIYDGAMTSLPPGVDACYGPNEKDDIEDCEELCRRLDVPYLALDLAKEYEEKILDYFRAEYRAGRTPNPCVRCNVDMKFGFLLERARASGVRFDYFATGHYARLAMRNGILHLRTALDATKDQTYFLHRLDPKTLAAVIFPLGEVTKASVKETARALGLKAAGKPESQDFVGGDYGVLFDSAEPGDIVDEEGNVLGRHKGIVHYTIVQRRGIGMSLGPTPMYVAGLDSARNRVIVSGNEELFASGLLGNDAILHDRRLEFQDLEVSVRIRQNHRPAAAIVSVQNGRAEVRFDDPQRAVAPGQSAVFYDGDGFVLGGCVIEKGIKL